MKTAFSPAAQGFLLALVATIVWSFNFIAGRGLTDAMGPCGLAPGRWLVAFVAVIPCALPEMLRLRRHFRAHWHYYLAVVVLGVAYFNTAIYWAAHSVPAINLSLIAALRRPCLPSCSPGCFSPNPSPRNACSASRCCC